MHEILRSRKLLEESGIAHTRLEGGRSNRRSHDEDTVTKRRTERKRGDCPTKYTERGGGEEDK